MRFAVSDARLSAHFAARGQCCAGGNVAAEFVCDAAGMREGLCVLRGDERERESLRVTWSK